MDNTAPNQKTEKVYLVIGIVGLILVVAVMFFIYSKNQFRKVDDIEYPIVKAKKDYFKDVTLTAKAAVVWDVKNEKFIYRKNEQDILPLASLTKLMTAVAATELLPERSTIRVSRAHFENGIDPILFAGENWETKKLIDLTLLTSSNSGARAIASVAGSFLPKNYWNTGEPEEVFVDYLNKRAKDLGLKSTNFYNDSGLDVNEEKSGAYGSARDIAILLDYILKNHSDILEATKHSNLTMVSADNLTHELKNTNIVVESIPGILGSKTGYTDLAQGNLAVAFSPGLEGPYIAIVLGSTFDGRFADVNELVKATIKTISQ